MANIIITDACNLKCPYCFANEFVNRDQNNISLSHFRTAKEFILTRERRIGLIGGEPLIHPDFREILRDLIFDRRVEKVLVFTNGILCDRYIDEFSNEKFRFLINCNSPKDIGDENFKKLSANLDLMISSRYMKESVGLGINMYKPDFEYRYLLDFLEYYHYDSVRVSITVPNSRMIDGNEIFMHFKNMMPRIADFFSSLRSRGIEPHYDCNKLPPCLYDEDENSVFTEKARRSQPVDMVRCNPVIDILQNLEAIRCFGLSRQTRVSISDFENIAELREYYKRNIDAYACNTIYHPNCFKCRNRLKAKCYGGCLAYKIDKIEKMQQYSEALMHES